MGTLLLFVLAAALGVQTERPATPLILDIRVFRGPTEVTHETSVALYRAGERTDRRPLSRHLSGAYRVGLRAGAYDLQLLQEQDGKVVGIAWSTLRLVADYPLEGDPQLEVLNFDKTYGAVQVRRARAGWTARLQRKDGTEAARSVAGDGSVVLVAPAATYDLVLMVPGQPPRVAEVAVAANVTTLRTF